MDTTPPFAPHVSPAALAHTVSLLVAHTGVTKTQIAESADLLPANLSHLETGKRSGEKTLPRLAAALGCHPLAITCWCDRPDRRCRNLPEVTS